MAHGVYGIVNQYAAEDNGNPYIRRINLDAQMASMAYASHDVSAGAAWYREMVFRPLMPRIVGAWTTPLAPHEKDPYNEPFEGRPNNDFFGYDEGYDTPFYYPDRAAEGNYYPQPDGTYKGVDYGSYERAYQAFLGNDMFAVTKITGNSEADAIRNFNEYAMERQFGDGLPLVPPTRELVDEMLASQPRDGDEVLGKIRMRKGVATVETVAVNAVMAGAKPEQFPVILAAIETVAREVENGNRYHHGATSGAAFSGLIIVSGDIVKQLGMNNGANYLGAGNDVNNTIGRAIRLSWKNIAHNWQPYIATGRSGGHNDHTFFVVAENDDALPATWKTHREFMGFAKDESVVTVTVLGRYVDLLSDAGSTNEPWTAQTLHQSIRTAPFAAQTCAIVTPAQAKALADWGATKENMQAAYNATTNPYGVGIYTQVVVAGTDPGRAVLLAPWSHNAWQSTGTQLIVTEAKQAPPGAPQNFSAVPGTEPGTMVLSWEPPTAPGRRDVTHYEVIGNSRDYGRWTTVPGGPDARSITLTNLDGNMEYYFRVRAVSGSYGPAGLTSAAPVPISNTFVPGQYGWGSRALATDSTDPLWNAEQNLQPNNAGRTIAHVGAIAARGSYATIRSTPSASIPMPVLGMHAVAGQEQVTLFWRAPLSDRGSDILRYEYRQRTGNDGEWGEWTDMLLGTIADLGQSGERAYRYFTIEGLDAGAYDYQIRAVNAIGAGEMPYYNAANALMSHISPPTEVTAAPAPATPDEPDPVDNGSVEDEQGEPENP